MLRKSKGYIQEHQLFWEPSLTPQAGPRATSGPPPPWVPSLRAVVTRTASLCMCWFSSLDPGLLMTESLFSLSLCV